MTSSDNSKPGNIESAFDEVQQHLSSAFDAVEAAEMGYWDLDLTNGMSGYRSFLHDKIFGHEESQAVWGLQIAKRHIIEEDHEVFEAAFARAMKTGKLDMEVRLKWKDGSLHWMAAKGRIYFDQYRKPVRASGVNYDITDRKEIETELVENLAKLKTAEEVADIGSWEYSISPQILTWSEGMYKLFENEPNCKVTLEHYLNYFIPEERQKIEAAFTDLKGDHNSLEDEFTVLIGEKRKTILVKVKVYYDNRGNPVKISGVNMDLTAQRQAEENWHSAERQRQKDVLTAVMETQEDERRRISEGLHNDFGQLLTAAKFRLPKESAEVAGLLNEAIKKVRSVSYELMPTILHDYGLEAALKDLFDTKLKTAGISHTVTLKGLRSSLATVNKIAIFRIIQEIINNVIKHSKATNVKITVVRDNASIAIEVNDNGVGFQAEGIRAKKGFGLKYISNRIHLLKGTFNIDSERTSGTRFSIVIPLTDYPDKPETVSKLLDD